MMIALQEILDTYFDEKPDGYLRKHYAAQNDLSLLLAIKDAAVELTKSDTDHEQHYVDLESAVDAYLES